MMSSIVFLFVVLVYNSDADIQQTGSQMVVTQVKILKCTSDLHMSHYPGQMVAFQEWNQVYVGENFEYVISHLQPLTTLTTMFTVELEKFDNNTDIYSSFKVLNASNEYKHVLNFTMHCSGSDRKLISLVDDGFYQYKIDSTLTYDDSKSIKFSCQINVPKILAVGVAWINSAGDRIFTYREPVISLNATAVHNGSMLCCVYYTMTSEQNVKTVQRFVKNKTLLIYRKGMANNGDQPYSGTTTCKTSKKAIRNSNTTNEIGNDLITTITETSQILRSTTIRKTDKNLSTTTNESGKKLSTKVRETGKHSNIVNATDKNSGPTSRTDSADHVSDTQTIYVIIISSVSALVLILLVSIFAIKTRCWKKNDRLERPRAPCQLPPNEPTPHTPFYVNLLFRRECDQEIRAREEPQYEEIIYQ